MKNFNRRALARFGAGALALFAAGAMVGLGGPAYADPAKPDLSVAVEGANITLDSPGKLVRIDVKNLSDAAAATGVKISFTVDSAEGVTIYVPNFDGCQVDGGTTTCPMDDLGPGETFNDVIVFVERKQDAPLGPAGKFTVNVKAAEGDVNDANNTASVPVSIVEAGVDLVAWAADLRNVRPGETVLLDWAVSNESNTPTASTIVEFSLPSYVTFAPAFTGCEIAEHRMTAKCVAEGIKFEDGFRTFDVPVVVDAAAPGPRNLGPGTITVSGQPATPAVTAQKQGKALKATTKSANAVSSENDKVGGDNTVSYAVTTAPSKADLAVTAAAASGKVGDVVGVNANAANHGPATSGPKFKIKAPAGTVLLNPRDFDSPSPLCWVGTGQKEEDHHFDEATEVTCTTEGELPPGRDFDFTLRFKIKSSTVGNDGKIEIFDVLGTPDPVTANNTAAITITVTVGSGGSLPITGVQAGLIGGVGLAVVAVGGALLLLSRRRRIVTVAPEDGSSES